MNKVQIFQLLQLCFLGLVIGTVLIFSRRQTPKSGFRITEAELRRAKGAQEPHAPRNAIGGVSTDRSGPSAVKPPELEMALPDWPSNMPPEKILGVSSEASTEVIEAAYKALLKKYHPDRYSHWGDTYESKAHVVVLRLKQAREEILIKRL